MFFVFFVFLVSPPWLLEGTDANIGVSAAATAASNIGVAAAAAAAVGWVSGDLLLFPYDFL